MKEKASHKISRVLLCEEQRVLISSTDPLQQAHLVRKKPLQWKSHASSVKDCAGNVTRTQFSRNQIGCEGWKPGPAAQLEGLELKPSDEEAHMHLRFPRTTLIFHSQTAGQTGHHHLLRKLPMEVVYLASSSAQAKWYRLCENQNTILNGFFPLLP